MVKNEICEMGNGNKIIGYYPKVNNSTITFIDCTDHTNISNIETILINELKRYLKYTNNEDIKLIVKDYEPDLFLSYLEPYKDLKEGYERCRVCFRKRLNQGYEYASKNGFEYFGTVMTISRYKNAQDINFIGESLRLLYPTTKWLYADFKKENGYENSLEICKEHNLYFQEYCGCKYSFLRKFSK